MESISSSVGKFLGHSSAMWIKSKTHSGQCYNKGWYNLRPPVVGNWREQGRG